MLLATQEEFEGLVKTPLTELNSNDAFVLLRGGLSLENELLVLKTLDGIARVRLAAFANCYSENVKALRGDALEMFSNERNAVVMVGAKRMSDA